MRRAAGIETFKVGPRRGVRWLFIGVGYSKGLSHRWPSTRQDKSAHMLRLGLDFTPLLMSSAIHNCTERMRGGRGTERQKRSSRQKARQGKKEIEGEMRKDGALRLNERRKRWEGK